ncbi:MAG TPA: hypothetical protein VH591_07900 [Ktedonobacterales bacterium]|jgi:hypothetical protein
MDAILIIATQATLSLLSFGLIAVWVIYPRLRERSLRDALTPLLLIETLRTVGLVVLIPGRVGAELPAGFAVPAAVGDMLAVVLAFVALVAVRAGWWVAPALVWLFSVVGLADFINATALGLLLGIPSYDLGIVWLLLTYAVPAFIVVHLVVIAVLLNSARRERQHAGGDREQAVDVPVRLTASIS